MLNVHYAITTPGKISSKQLRGKLSAALLNSQKRMLKYLNQYVSTWNHPVSMSTKGNTHYAGGDIWAGIYIDDEIFWWLEEGTSVRYATMSQDFAPKTANRQIQSKQGAGGVQYVDTRIGRPGIEAREILKEIATLDGPKFQSDIRSIIANVSFFDIDKLKWMI
jgi:hypothetical protein